MKVLFIGGTGVISSACSELCIKNGYDLYLLNRGESFRKIPEKAKFLKGDIRNFQQVKEVIKDLNFDVVVDWVAYTPDHIKTDFELFNNRTDQFIFISSASVYQKPPSRLPVTESEPIGNKYWAYAENKALCEKLLMELCYHNSFPVTIVRPSHTYDKTKTPFYGGYTVLDRMYKNKPVILHGDGTSVWTLTHNTDFAKGFIGLFGNQETIGEAYHITSDEMLTWNQIIMIIGNAAGVEPGIVHIPSSLILRYDKEWGDGLLGDKAHSMIFDNSKIKKINPGFKAVIPYSEGVKEILNWFGEKDSRQQIDVEKDQLMDKLAEKFSNFL